MQQGKKTAGHPVDVASGTVYSTHEDISIPGKVDLVWERRYSTALLDKPPSPLGPGWTTRYFATLIKADGEFRFLTPEGEIEIFADPGDTVNRGGIVRNLGAFQEIAKRRNEFIVTRWDVETGEIVRYVFKQGRQGEVWPLASIEDITGQALNLLRDNSGRLTGIRQRLEKRTLHIEYNSNNQISSVSFLLPGNKRQVLARYEFDKSGRLSAAYNALGHADRYEYDANGRMTREIVKDGGIFFFKYDEKGRCLRTSGLDSYDEKTFRYLDHIGWTEVTNSLSRVMRFQWLPSGQVISEIDPLGGAKKTDYDEQGRIASKIDPNGAVTKYEYDEQGNRCKIIEPLGREILFAFNQHHQTLTLTDPVGNIWRSAYDTFNRWVAIENPLGHRWSFNYDAQGNLAQVADPHGTSRRLLFSQNGQLLETTDCMGNPTSYVEDHFGNLIQRIDPSGKVVNFHYDLLGRLLQIESSDDSQVSLKYDVGGNMTELIDSNGYSTKFRYGSCRRLLERIDHLGRVQKFIWGSEPDRLEMIINEKGEIYTFVYDEAGRVIEETGFDGIKLAFKYDMAGYCVATINGLGEECSYTRNKLGRLVKKTLPDGTVCLFEYDILGNLISAVNPSCKVRFERDPLGRVIKEYQGDFIIENEYDAAGNLIVTKTSQGHNIRYAFDNNRLLSSLTTGDNKTWQFHRNTEGRETSRRLPGGINLEQQHNLVGQLATQYVSLPEEIIRRAYHYDKSGNLTMLEDSRWGNTQYMYDPAERIIQAIREKGFTEHFSYGSTDNITKILAIKTSDGNSTGIETAKNNSINSSSSIEEALEYGQGNRLLRRGNTRYFYDDNGRLIKKVKNSGSADPKEWNFSWSADNQLASITKPDGVIWKYAYDPFGRRISKQGPKGDTQFIWYQDVIIHQLQDQTLESTWVFDPHSFKPLCKLQGDSTYSVITDQLGTPKELVDGRGKVVWAASAKTWGEIEAIKANEVDCPIRFPGQWYDEESGLAYNRFRYYDPENGRFISRDPIGLLGGLNEYVYTPNPISWIDPLGLIPVYRNIRSEESSAAGLQAQRPGRNMSPAGQIMNGSRHNGSQFISTTTDPAVAARWREPGQVTVRFDTDAVVPDSAGNLRIVDVSTPEQAQAQGLRGRAYSNAVASREVLVEGRVPSGAIEEVDPEEC